MPEAWTQWQQQTWRTESRLPSLGIASRTVGLGGIGRPHSPNSRSREPKFRRPNGAVVIAACAAVAACRRCGPCSSRQIASPGVTSFANEGAKVLTILTTTVSCLAAGRHSGIGGAIGPWRSRTPHRRSVRLSAILPKTRSWMRRSKHADRKYLHAPRYEDGVPIEPVLPHFGKYAVQAVEETWMTSRQLEKIRRILVQSMDRRGKVFIRVFPHEQITQRLAESRTGASDGNVEYWVAAVRRDFIIFELDGVSDEVAYHAIRQASYSLPCKVRMLKRADRASMFELEA